MVGFFQAQINYVLRWAGEFHAVVEQIEGAIEEAWATTRRQIEEAAYDQRIVQTAFAQFLEHNIRNEIFRLGHAPGEVETDLIPNRNRSAHHVVVRFRNFWITVSAVKTRADRPRPARFRTDYARRQMRFIVNDNNFFEAAPPPEPGQNIHTYIQILHGPASGNRQLHGFTLIAFANQYGEYQPRPMEVAEYLNNGRQPQEEVAEEIILEDFDIAINDQAHYGEEQCPQERPDLRAQN